MEVEKWEKSHFAALLLSCIILNANQRTQNGGGLGMRLLLSHMLKTLFSLSKVDGGWFQSKFGKFLSVQLHWDMTYWDMATLAIPSALSLHFETHLVPLWVGVEWWAMPLVTVNLVLLKVCSKFAMVRSIGSTPGSIVVLVASITMTTSQRSNIMPPFLTACEQLVHGTSRCRECRNYYHRGCSNIHHGYKSRAYHSVRRFWYRRRGGDHQLSDRYVWEMMPRSQALAQLPVACSTILQATGSWARAWERG